MEYFEKDVVLHAPCYMFHDLTMQFQVPQFIEVEDKIIGPLTGKQFFYLVGAGALVFLLRTFLEWWLVIILGGPVVGLAVAMAFLKINGIPFIKIMSNAITYYISGKLFLWKKKPSSSSAAPSPTLPLQRGGREGVAPKLTENRLQDLAWSLDIQHKPLNRK